MDPCLQHTTHRHFFSGQIAKKSKFLFFVFVFSFTLSHNKQLFPPNFFMGLCDKHFKVVRKKKKEWLVMIHGLPCRLSISDRFSVTMISANMTSEYHNNFLSSFFFFFLVKYYLMPSWFHLIGIALNLLFLFLFCFFAVCLLVDSNLQPSHPFAFFILFFYPFPFLLYQFNY